MNLKKQMYILSGCLLKLGRRNLALLVQRPPYWEFACEFVKVAVRDATEKQNTEVLTQLANAGLTRKLPCKK